MGRKKTENNEESKRDTLRANEMGSSPSKGISESLTACHNFQKGDKVRLKKTATIYGCDIRFLDELYNSVLYIRSIKGNRVTIQIYDQLGIAGAVNIKDLVKA